MAIEEDAYSYVLSGAYNPNKIMNSISKAEILAGSAYYTSDIKLTSSGQLYSPSAYFKGTYKYILVFK